MTAAPRSLQRGPAVKTPTTPNSNDSYSAKDKNNSRRYSSRRFLPLWFVFLIFLSLAAVSVVDRRKRQIWEKTIRDYLEPPPIGIKLIDKDSFSREDVEAQAAKSESGVSAVGSDDVAAPPPKAPPRVLEDDPDLLRDPLGIPLHIVFSTDCSPFQHWQSYLLFYSALRSRQPGTVTRIASGCSEGDAEALTRWHDEHITVMSARFRLHLTPHFSSIKIEGEKAKDYKYFNKPFGLRHWLENGGSGGTKIAGIVNYTAGERGDDADRTGEAEKSGPDAVVVLLDPDMIILRPITTDFSSNRDVIIPKRVLKDRKMKVTAGVPFGQAYGMGAHWKEFDLDAIIGTGVPSPARELPRQEGLLRYAVGPPYIASLKDMYAIAEKWTEFVPGVYMQYPKLLAEMYGYCIAAAHLELPHQKVESLMVSDPTLTCEGWDFVETMPDGEVCSMAVELDHSKHPLPNVMHYCQRYSLGKHSFHKRTVSHSFFACADEGDKKGSMLSGPLPMLSADSDLHYNSTTRMRKNQYKVVELSRGEVKREIFALCTIRGAMNEALEYYREQHCDK